MEPGSRHKPSRYSPDGSGSPLFLGFGVGTAAIADSGTGDGTSGEGGLQKNKTKKPSNDNSFEGFRFFDKNYYMFLMISSPNSEHFNKVAPSIIR